MKKLTSLAVIIGLATSASAFAANSDNTGYYAGAKLGTSLEQIHGQKSANGSSVPRDTKQAGTAGLVFGYNFQNEFNLPIRAELDYSFRDTTDTDHFIKADNTRTHNRVRLQTAMLNGYYDINTDTAFTPYISAGIGYANVNLKNTQDGASHSGNGDNFAWSVGTGVSYAINNHLDLDLGYKYLDAGDATAQASKVKVATHDFTAGVNYYF
ncbi:outer membrane protein [Hafnia paralvei]|uniref:outer membrane protein n=1 Tax=Hafnia paralvei TaxID=546367 RepID=UPI001C04547E|nr:outer membrane protein [Hafnia paralvei]MBU2672890.1 porin family protein [Hafnia paralvei]MDX6842026.1 outer membrane protein [Hafnia paralvei]